MVSGNRMLGPAVRALFWGCQSSMRRRRKRRHVESGPAEFATAVGVDVGTNVNVNGGGLLREDNGERVTDLLWTASLLGADISSSSEQTPRLLWHEFVRSPYRQDTDSLI